MQLQNGDALIVVDVQRDFLPGGALAVPGGDEIVSVLNGYLQRFRNAGLPIVATRDWHPPDHCSFNTQGGLWPGHCVRGSRGAEFPEELELPPDARIVSKGTEPGAEAYSGFDRTMLQTQLQDTGVRRLFVGGLATDYCVLATVQDAAKAGFEVLVLGDAVRAVNISPDDEEKALAAMREAGATVIDLTAIDFDG